MKVHPIAAIWPQPSEDDFVAIRDAIAREGLLVPVVTWRGELVDGRQRLRACEETSTPIRVEALPDEWDERAVAYHVAALHARRNLTPSQRSAVGGMLAKRYWKEGKDAQVAAGKEHGRGQNSLAQPCAKLSEDDSPPPPPKPRAPKSTAKAAKAAGASPRGVEQARRILETDPDLYARVLAGEITVTAAEKQIKRAEAERVIEKRIAEAPPPKPDDSIVIVEGDAVAVAMGLAPNSIACLLTDPPYGIDTHRTRQGGHDYADGEDYALGLLSRVLDAAMPALTNDAHVYVFSGYTYLERFRDVLVAKGLDVQPWPIVWVKDNHTMCAFDQWYPCRYEYILFARRSKARPLAACIPSVLTYARSDARDLHSASKPVDLLRVLLEQSTRKGERVFDPFAGSGSTLVAAKQCGRHAVGAEIDPEFVKITRGRLA